MRIIKCHPIVEEFLDAPVPPRTPPDEVVAYVSCFVSVMVSVFFGGWC